MNKATEETKEPQRLSDKLELSDGQIQASRTGIETESLQLPIEKKAFLSALGVEKVDNNYTPIQILENFDSHRIREFLRQSYDRINDEMVYGLEKAFLKDESGGNEELRQKEMEALIILTQRVIEELLIESSGAEKKREISIKDKFSRSLKPGTRDIEKLGLAGDRKLFSQTAELILTSTIKISEGNFLPAGANTENKKTVEKLDLAIKEINREKYIKELEAEMLNSPDELLRRSETLMEKLREKRRKGAIMLQYAFNHPLKSEKIAIEKNWEADEKKLLMLEIHKPLYEKEKAEEIKKLARVRSILTEITAGLDPLDFSISPFFLVETATAFSKESALIEERRYGQILAEITGDKLSPETDTLISSPETELKKDEYEEITEELEQKFMKKIGQLDEKASPAKREAILLELFERDAFYRLCQSVCKQKKILNEIAGLNQRNLSLKDIDQTRHLLGELISADQEKDRLFLQVIDEYGYLRCRPKKQKLEKSLGLDEEEKAIVQQELKKVQYNPRKSELKVQSEEISQPVKRIVVEKATVESLQAENLSILDKKSQIEFTLLSAKKTKEYLSRKWNTHK